MRDTDMVSSNGRSSCGQVLAVLGFLVVGLLNIAPAFADHDRDGGEGRWHRHRHWERPIPVPPAVVYYGAPPVVYAPPPVYYAPPPPVVYGGPTLNVTVPLRFR